MEVPGIAKYDDYYAVKQIAEFLGIPLLDTLHTISWSRAMYTYAAIVKNRDFQFKFNQLTSTLKK